MIFEHLAKTKFLNLGAIVTILLIASSVTLAHFVRSRMRRFLKS